MARAKLALLPSKQCGDAGCIVQTVKNNFTKMVAGDATVAESATVAFPAVWVVIAIIAIVLMALAISRSRGCPLGVYGIFTIILSIVFPPAGIIMSALAMLTQGKRQRANQAALMCV
jgi:hypothetical protein